MTANPTIKPQNQAPLPGHPSSETPFAPVAKAAATLAPAARFVAIPLFENFLRRIMGDHAPGSAVQSMTQAARTAKETDAARAKSPLQHAAADKSAPAAKGTFEATFIRAFGRNAYAQSPKGEPKFLPRTSEGWGQFFKSVQSLGSHIQEVRVRLSDAAKAGLFRGILEQGMKALFVGDLLLASSDQPQGRQGRWSFVQIPLPEGAADIFKTMVPGQAVSAEELSLLGQDEVPVQRLIHGLDARESEAAKRLEDASAQDLLGRLRSASSPGQHRMETWLFPASRLQTDDEERYDYGTDRATAKPSVVPIPMATYRDVKLPLLPRLRLSMLGYWLTAILVTVTVYLLIRAL